VNTRTRTSALLALLVAVTVTAVACTPGADDGNEEAPSSSVTKTEPDTLDWLLVATEDGIVGGWVPEENIALIDTIKHIAISEECWNLADSREVLLVNPTSAIVGAPGP
jgi:hypothetical protein